jgi:2',3'-cyclic-nucleotide 2'-phosphodiesterase (5'-nucleotidase family)
MIGCSPSTSSHLHIVVSGDTAGWITPCGCTANQSGGLERRASLIKSFGAIDRVVYLDVGGSAAGKSEYQQVKLKSILQGDQLMGLEVHNIGAPETQLSANLQMVNADDSTQSAIASHRVIVKHGVRILVIGVIDPSLVKNPLWKARDASASVLTVLQNVQADIRLVLAYMDEPGLRALAESLPEVDYVIGGPTGQMLAPSSVGPVEVMSATNKGKFLAKIELQKMATGW